MFSQIHIMYFEMITTIKLINIPITSDQFYVCVLKVV